MARYQYRVDSTFSWASSPGNAVVALLNKGNSGKRMTLRSFEVASHAWFDWRGVGVSNQVHTETAVYRGTVSGGDLLQASPADSTAVWPSGLRVATQGAFVPSGAALSTAKLLSDFDSVTNLHLPFRLRNDPLSHVLPRRHGVITESITIRPGECVGWVIDASGRQSDFSVSAVLSIDGKTWVCSTRTAMRGVSALMTFDNGSSSVVKLTLLTARMLGRVDVTPYLQLVPALAVDPTAIASNEFGGILKMDSAYPDPSAWVSVVADAPITPNAPIQYASEAGAGAPKGANYLVTKDFLGPTLRAFFPELRTHSVAPSTSQPPDTLGYSGHKHVDLLARRAGITLRPGEALALTAAAETFGSSSAGIGSQYCIRVGAIFDIENLVQPYLTLNGLQPGSDIVILDGSTILQQIDAYSGTSWTWPYDSDIVTSVDVCVYKPGFVPLALRNVTTPAEGLSIPIVQTLDRNYA